MSKESFPQPPDEFSGPVPAQRTSFEPIIMTDEVDMLDVDVRLDSLKVVAGMEPLTEEADGVTTRRWRAAFVYGRPERARTLWHTQLTIIEQATTNQVYPYDQYVSLRHAPGIPAQSHGAHEPNRISGASYLLRHDADEQCALVAVDRSVPPEQVTLAERQWSPPEEHDAEELSDALVDLYSTRPERVISE